MKARFCIVLIAVGAACSARGRHADAPTAPDTWVTTLDQPSRRAVRTPTSAPTPTPRAACTVVQKLAMQLSGMTDDQIRRACE